MNAQNDLLAQSIETAMSAAEPQVEILPSDAPFDPAQRQWLNGLLTGLSAVAASAAAAWAGDAAAVAAAARGLAAAVCPSSSTAACVDTAHGTITKKIV